MNNDSMSKNTSKTFVKGAMIMTASVVVVKLLGMFYKIFLYRMYANFDQFEGVDMATLGTGILSNAYEIYTPLFALATAGFPVAVSRLIAESIAQKRYRDVATIHKASKKLLIGAGLICFPLMIAFSFFYVNFVNQPLSIYSMMTLSPAIFLGCLVSIYRGYYEGQRNMLPSALSEVIEMLVKVVTGLSMGYLVMKIGMDEYAARNSVFGQHFDTALSAMKTLLSYSVAAAIAGISIGSLATFLFLRLYYAKNKFIVTDQMLQDSIDARTQSELFNGLVKTAVPIILSALVMNAFTSIDGMIVQRVLYKTCQTNLDGLIQQFDPKYRPDMIEWARPLDGSDPTLHSSLWGCFGNALTLMNLVVTVTQQFGISALPNVTAAYSSGDKSELRRSINTVLKMTMMFTLPAGLSMFAIARPVITLLYGGGFGGDVSTSILRVMGFSCIVVAISTPMMSMLNSLGKVHLPLILSSIAMGIKIVTNYLFVSMIQLNVTGAAIGSLVAFGCVSILAMYLLIKHSGVRPDFINTTLKPLICGAICAATAFGVYTLFNQFVSYVIAMAVAIVVAVIVYAIALMLMKTFTEEELYMLPKGKNIVTILAKWHLLR